MEIMVFPDEEFLARKAAAFIAREAWESVEARGWFTLAVSGGKTPWKMLRHLAGEDLPWESLSIIQVDERVAPSGGPDRNLTGLKECLLGPSPLRPEQILAMPVEQQDIELAAREYARALRGIAGTPPQLDLVHLGLGSDGHTASLVPGDPVLDVADRDVALTGTYQGRMRMTLTFPLINRARRILWLVAGSGKADALSRLKSGDDSIPAGRIAREQAFILADSAAAGFAGLHAH
ncbi:MAG: 6-phosphogluconolactonase [Candidatus Eremiobacteraeota bacterium]|nr:6-phosphogluconolactonase [Candidatus Eremiobacteraeota bacterium]